MCDEWMPSLSLPLTAEQFNQLPRHAAYKYEYRDGRLFLSPRPRHYHALLDLPAVTLEETRDLTVRPLRREDAGPLAEVFAAAFDRVQPFGGLNDAQRLEAAQSCLERTLTDGD